MTDETKTALLSKLRAPVAKPIQWPTMPPSKGQSPVLFEDGYAEGWAKCMDECRRAVSAASAPVADEAVRDVAFEAVRKQLCKLPRYSFFAGAALGSVRRVEDRSGNWIEFDAAHALFDPVAVDAALSAQPGAQKYCQWQPIETAPKDEVILLFGGLKKDGKVYAPHINVGYWTEQFGWTCLVHSHQEFAHIEPTHWMPRPPFPAQAYPDNKEQ